MYTRQIRDFSSTSALPQERRRSGTASQAAIFHSPVAFRYRASHFRSERKPPKPALPNTESETWNVWKAWPHGCQNHQFHAPIPPTCLHH